MTELTNTGSDESNNESSMGLQKNATDIEKVDLMNKSVLGPMNDPSRDDTMTENDVVTNRTFTGRSINKMHRQWELLKRNPELSKRELAPWYRGNVLCFAYVSCCRGDSIEPLPLYTIGPDWRFSLLEILLMNLFVGFAATRTEGYLHNMTLMVLFIQNLSFIMTIISNPGMLRRDPTIHPKEYLCNIASGNKEKALCLRCNLIKP